MRSKTQKTPLLYISEKWGLLGRWAHRHPLGQKGSQNGARFSEQDARKSRKCQALLTSLRGPKRAWAAHRWGHNRNLAFAQQGAGIDVVSKSEILGQS